MMRYKKMIGRSRFIAHDQIRAIHMAGMS